MWDSGCVKVTSPFGYLAAVLVVLGGWVLATVVAAGAWDVVRESTPVPVTQERADAAGSSIAVFTDIEQPDLGIGCTATPEDGEPITIDEAAIDIVVDTDGTRWQLINLLPEGADGLEIACAPSDDRLDNASYAFAVVDGFADRGERGQAIATTGLIAGLALAGWTFFCRRARTSTTRESESS